MPTKGKDPWQKCHRLTEKHDEEMCEAWKEEIDKLLIFVRVSTPTHCLLSPPLGRFVLSNCNRVHR